MAQVALTTIQHGYVEDGDNVVLTVPEGESVTELKKVTDKDEFKALVDQGAIGEPPKTAQERDDELEAERDRADSAEAQVADLEAKLKALQAEKKTT
jgi:hypothetical protein